MTVSKQSLFSRCYSKIIGICRESRGNWECRAPLSPSAIKKLSEKYSGELEFHVESSSKRIYPDAQYEQNNARVVDVLQDCDLILGLKQIPVERIRPNTSYLFFSHTHKGQLVNMPILKQICSLKSSLYDYELIVDPKMNQRTVAFGRFAGYSGMIMALHGLGLKLLERGIRSPFLHIPQTQCFTDLKAAKEWITSIGRDLDLSFGPLVFVFTGNGRVSQGAQEVFKWLPHEFVDVKSLPNLMTQYKKNVIYGCVVEAKDYAVNGNGHFDAQEYRLHPDRYQSRFNDRCLPYASVVVNGLYWDLAYPRIITNEDLPLAKRLLCIADISCDLNGGIEFTSHASTIDAPYWDYKGIQMMTIDNLPTQLPRDSSEYFSAKLEPLIPAFVGLEPNASIKSSQIVEKGQIVDRFSFLNNIIKDIPARKHRALVLGSGYVSGPVMEYLRKNGIQVTVASNESSCEVLKCDVLQDTALLENLIKDHDIVISLVAATMHVPIAEACIKHKKNLVTASYISPAMQALHEKATKEGVLLLNEIGLDPGLDHLAAMKMIDEARDQGWSVESFVSWCGGLPAPEDSNNILGYKFSWSPKGVLLATQNDAQFLRHGQVIKIPGSELLTAAYRLTDLNPGFAFEGIPNRDSLKYQKLYGLPKDNLKTMLRGTLRYSGFSSLMHQFKQLGLLRNEVLSTKSSWLDYFKSLSGLKEVSPESLMIHLGLTSEESGRLFGALRWFGVFDSSSSPKKAAPIDNFCSLLQDKLKYQAGERDLVYLHHEFLFRDQKGNQNCKTLTLCEYGDPKGFSAMARTVGYPVAVAAKLILDGKIKTKGVTAPLTKEFYSPILQELASSCNIVFK